MTDDWGCRELAVAVILQALTDAKHAQQYGDDLTAAGVAAREARLFLTEEIGPWALSRKTWCEYAGLDPDRFYEQVKGMKHESGSSIRSRFAGLGR